MVWKLILLMLFSLNSLASESDVYKFKWLDQDKKVFVLQNREYRKEDKFYLSLSAALITSGKFTKGNGFQGRLGYFFHENWGIQLIYAANSNSENESAEAIINQGTVPFYRGVKSYLGGTVEWSPFYSKINTFNSIVYADWIIGLGAVSVSDEHNGLRFSSFSNDELTSESHVGLTWHLSSVFYISRNWAARVDFTGIHYNADGYTASGISGSTLKKKLYNYYDISLGIQYIF